MLLKDIEDNPDFLCYYCSRCPIKEKCDRYEQDVFENEIYRNCMHRYKIVKRMLKNYGIKQQPQFFPLEDLVFIEDAPRRHLCDSCHILKDKGRWVRETEQWICYDCYPKTKCPYGKEEFY